MSDLYQVITPENIELDYEVAGIGSRFLALTIDTIIQGALTVGLFYGISLLGLENLSLNEDIDNLLTSVSGAIMLFFLGIIWLGYFIIFETIWNGQTIGKRVVNIRVRKDLGYAPGFWDILLRNLIRPVDFIPSCYGTGFLVMFLSKKAKRLGDYAAGTLVVKEKPKRELRKILASQGIVNNSPLDIEYLAEQYPWLNKINALLKQSDYLILHNLLSRKKDLINFEELCHTVLLKITRGKLDEAINPINISDAEKIVTYLAQSYEKGHFN